MRSTVFTLLMMVAFVSSALCQSNTHTGTVAFGPADPLGGKGLPSIGIGYDYDMLTLNIPINEASTLAADVQKSIWYAVAFNCVNLTNINQIGLAVQTYGNSYPSTNKLWVAIYQYSGNVNNPLGSLVVPLTEIKTNNQNSQELKYWDQIPPYNGYYKGSVGLGNDTSRRPCMSQNTNTITSGPGINDEWYSSVFTKINLNGNYVLVISPANAAGSTADVLSFGILTTGNADDGSQTWSNTSNGVGSWRKEAGFGPQFQLIANAIPPYTTVVASVVDSNSNPVNCTNYLAGRGFTYKVIASGETGTGTVGAGNSITFNVNYNGTSDICIKVNGSLSLKKTNVSLGSGSVNIGSLAVITPDFMDDDVIDDFDLNEINGGFGNMVTPGFGADYNCDGVYDDFDLNQVNGSFGAVGECFGL